jgi:hypothetical protein
MTPLTIETPSESSAVVTLTGPWGIARAADLHRQLGEALAARPHWTLCADKVESADLAVWQVLYRAALVHPHFQLRGETPALDALSAALGLPSPEKWEAIESSGR